MKRYFVYFTATVLCASVAWAQEGDPAPGPSESQDGVEVLTRGPVHEAFAETITFNPKPGVVVEHAVPEAIEEVPPDQKPDGADVDWIPGYWAWDEERNDFLWVSGIWRSLPPGRQWVPGYWGESGRNSQWTSGYWADAEASEIDYLPEPPEAVEEDSSTESPSENQIWLPGCWVWRQDHYIWRPGSWARAQPNWVWIPAHYVWAPRGYVFIDGYYDHSVARRGVVFAPVYFSPTVYARRGFSYTPLTVIQSLVFANHLFLRPSYGHYYFGDYYGSDYLSSGFSPWFSFSSSRFGYDPFYAHQRWHHRNDGQWNRRLEADFARRRDHQEERPPRTWAAQNDAVARAATKHDAALLVGASLADLVKNKDSAIRFQKLAKVDRDQIGQRGREVRTASEQRKKIEAAGTAPKDSPGRTGKTVSVRLPKTPIVSRPINKLGADDAPPEAVTPPTPDPKIQPKPRKAAGPDPKVEPEAPKVEPKTPKVEPKTPKVEPKAPKVQPKAPKVEPKAPKVEPKAPKVQPKAPKVQPMTPQPKVQPKAPKVAPKAKK